MKRRFVICVDDSTKQQQDSVTNFLKDKGLGYWHWYSDLWLATDVNCKWSSNDIRDELKKVVPGAYHLVIQIDGENTWSAFGRTSIFNWLHETWSKD